MTCDRAWWNKWNAWRWSPISKWSTPRLFIAMALFRPTCWCNILESSAKLVYAMLVAFSCSATIDIMLFVLKEMLSSGRDVWQIVCLVLSLQWFRVKSSFSKRQRSANNGEVKPVWTRSKKKDGTQGPATHKLIWFSGKTNEYVMRAFATRDENLIELNRKYIWQYRATAEIVLNASYYLQTCIDNVTAPGHFHT